MKVSNWIIFQRTVLEDDIMRQDFIERGDAKDKLLVIYEAVYTVFIFLHLIVHIIPSL